MIYKVYVFKKNKKKTPRPHLLKKVVPKQSGLTKKVNPLKIEKIRKKRRDPDFQTSQTILS
jgi:hypothetical protein